MKVFVLEGSNDVAFIKSVLNHHFNKAVVPTAYDKNLKKGIKELMRKLRDSSEYHYLKANFGFIVYGDNGKQNVISKVLPRLCYDLLGKSPPEQAELLVILDEDGNSLKNTLIKIKEEIINREIPDSVILDVSGDCFKIQLQSDESYWILVRVYLIPQNLEYQIVCKGITRTSDISKKQKEKLLNADPHKALEKLASLQKSSKETLIQQSVTQGWFSSEDWYKLLVNKINEFLKS